MRQQREARFSGAELGLFSSMTWTAQAPRAAFNSVVTVDMEKVTATIRRMCPSYAKVNTIVSHHLL